MGEVLYPEYPERMLVSTSKISYRKVGSKLTRVVPTSFQKLDRESETDVHWGREARPTWSASLTSLGLMICTPLLVMVSWATLSHYEGSLLDFVIGMYREGPWQLVAQYNRVPFLPVFGVYVAWILCQSALYSYIPSKLSTGQLTPAGHLLQYHTNGLVAWAVTHLALASGVFLRVIDPAWIAKNWLGLLMAAGSYGFLLSVVVYIKAYIAPTHARDRKFSGSMLYDFHMGIEFNPRLGEFWDFKLFHIGRSGMNAWTLINLSFAAWQYEKFGHVTNSMMIINLLHGIYTVDFFINEGWYLRTIDIGHDHFGFYLAWGSVIWLPAMYTIQAQYLAYNPVSVSPLAATCIAAAGLGGYIIFRSVNHEKDLVRRTKGECLIWGRPAGVLRCNYMTADGKQHGSILLYTGWWGVSRHANYLGDLILSYSMCATCGFRDLLPWFYAIFMTILLLHRSKRAEQSCAAKYGKDWDKYCERVRWVLIPGIY